MFSNLLKTAKAAKSAGAAKSLKVNDSITLKARGDGGKGCALVIGRITIGDKQYASKESPLIVTLEMTDKSNAVTLEAYTVKDSDSVHLGQVEGGIAAVQAVIANVTKCVVKRIETKAEYDARIAKEAKK